MHNPYAGKPDQSFWKRSVGGRAATEVDPIVRPRFTIGRTDKIATAGSCFAQHISRTLGRLGFGYFVPEDKPAFGFCEDENYGTYSARYGNVYTVRQLWQLFQRAYGLFDPEDVVWQREDGRFVDPFRPRIQAGGYAMPSDLLADREAHFAAVRSVFEDCDVLVFTLGLTEGWEAKTDGAVFPLVPGVVADGLDVDAYGFHNFTVPEMDADLTRFLKALRKVNPSVRVMLTVSPVALVATYEDRHVLTSTVYSKSALRVVAQMAADAHDFVDYFPSYEMITGPHTRGAFWADDLREVRPEGVDYVMSRFAAHYLRETGEGAGHAAPAAVSEALVAAQLADIERLEAVICDEEQIEIRS